MRVDKVALALRRAADGDLRALVEPVHLLAHVGDEALQRGRHPLFALVELAVQLVRVGDNELPGVRWRRWRRSAAKSQT